MITLITLSSFFDKLLMSLILFLLACTTIVIISVISSIVLSTISVNITNPEVINKEILKKFEEYLRTENIFDLITILNFDDTNGNIVYVVSGETFIAKLIGDKFYRMQNFKVKE